jgi:hypothetical protein
MSGYRVATDTWKSADSRINSGSSSWVFLMYDMLHHLAGGKLECVPHRPDVPQTVRKYANML